MPVSEPVTKDQLRIAVIDLICEAYIRDGWKLSESQKDDLRQRVSDAAKPLLGLIRQLPIPDGEPAEDGPVAAGDDDGN